MAGRRPGPASSNAQFDKLRQLLEEKESAGAKFDSEDISIVVFGSLARYEWTSGSDLDFLD